MGENHREIKTDQVCFSGENGGLIAETRWTRAVDVVPGGVGQPAGHLLKTKTGNHISGQRGSKILFQDVSGSGAEVFPVKTFRYHPSGPARAILYLRRFSSRFGTCFFGFITFVNVTQNIKFEKEVYFQPTAVAFSQWAGKTILDFWY